MSGCFNPQKEVTCCIVDLSTNFTNQERRALAMNDTAIREAMDYEK